MLCNGWSCIINSHGINTWSSTFIWFFIFVLSMYLYFFCQMCSDARRSIHALTKWWNYCKGSKTGRSKNVPFLLFLLWCFHCSFSNDMKSVHLKQIAYSHALSSGVCLLCVWLLVEFNVIWFTNGKCMINVFDEISIRDQFMSHKSYCLDLYLFIWCIFVHAATSMANWIFLISSA